MILDCTYVYDSGYKMIFQLHRFLSIYCLYSISKSFPFSLIYSLFICLSVIGMDSCCFQWLIIHYWPWLLWCSNGPSCDRELFKLTPVPFWCAALILLSTRFTLWQNKMFQADLITSLSWNQPFLWGTLVLETKIWALCVHIAFGASLLFSSFSCQS